VIENVAGSDLPDAIELCGSMFGLPIRRHRWFSSSQFLYAAGPCRHTPEIICCVGNKVRGYGTLRTNHLYLKSDGTYNKRESYLTRAAGCAAMGIDWMTVAELSQAIPPAYTRWIGSQLFDNITHLIKN
jgi:DNA (cytosine-5)-methyltransferase 1